MKSLKEEIIEKIAEALELKVTYALLPPKEAILVNLPEYEKINLEEDYIKYRAN